MYIQIIEYDIAYLYAIFAADVLLTLRCITQFQELVSYTHSIAAWAERCNANKWFPSAENAQLRKVNVGSDVAICFVLSFLNRNSEVFVAAANYHKINK